MEWPVFLVLARVSTSLAKLSGDTKIALAKEAAALGGGGGGRRVLDLRRRRGARLAHGVCSVHDCGGGGLEWRSERW